MAGGAGYEVLASPARIREALEGERDGGCVALEVETEGGEAFGAALSGIGLCFEFGGCYYVPLHAGAPDPEALLAELGSLLGRGGAPKVTHDGKLYLVVLGQRGLRPAPPVFDTLLAAFLVDGRSLELEDLAAARLGADALEVARAAPGTAPEERARRTCARARAVMLLCGPLQAELIEREQLRYLEEVELPLVPLLAEMELAGIAVDAAALEALSERLARRLRELEAQMAQTVGHAVDPRSPRRLARLLYEELGLRGSRKTSSGRYSTDALALEELLDSHPVVEKIVEHRRLSRLKDAYADALPGLVDAETGRLHTTFSQVAASSGRIVSRKPNLQNVPVRTEMGRRIRRAFVADGSGLGIPGPTVLLSVDYSQIELRVLAHAAGEERLIEAFLKGEDVHALAAARLYGVPPEDVDASMRRVGKMLNYGVIYGMTGYRLALEAGIDRREASAFVRRHREQYPAVRAYFERTLEEAEHKGYVETPLGRRRYLPDLYAKNRARREAARRAAENMPNQGMVAEIIKLAMSGVHARLRGKDSRLLLQVHDELLLEVPEVELRETAGLVVSEMEGAVQLSVPLRAEARQGPSWAETRPL